ncbi:MAG: hypothetical protein ACXWG6_09440 [Usitatibacter sp.]
MDHPAFRRPPSLAIAAAIVASAAMGVFAAMPASAAKKTVCTITVNSSDEREAFRRFLPKEKYDFVELLEKGRPDWLRSSCEKGVQCDVLVVSGHFNAGETFYSDKVDNGDFLKVDELERASCSNSCPGVFAHLKEVYLFGCESLNPDATRYSSSYGESGRDRMRRLFANVPSIYGFSGAAPVGATAAALLSKYFGNTGGSEIASGRPNAALLRQFSANRMTIVSGVRDGEPAADYRHDVCQFYDERKEVAQKLAFVHGLLRRNPAELRRYFERIEKLLASVDDLDRQSPSYALAVAEISRDTQARERFLASARASGLADRSRMLVVAQALGWLSPAQLRGEQMTLVETLLARPSLGFAEVDLVCSINEGGELTPEFSHSDLAKMRPVKVGHAAALACLGSAENRAYVLRAIAGADDRDVQVAQAYLRRRPMIDSELRIVAAEISRMPESRAQIRALDTLGMHNIADRAVLEQLARSFSAARSLDVQRAIAEVFLRSDPKAIAKPQLVSVLREHRLKSSHGSDLIDVLIDRLQGS